MFLTRSLCWLESNNVKALQRSQFDRFLYDDAYSYMLINFKFDQFLNWLVSRGVAFFVARGIKFEFSTSDVNNIVAYRRKKKIRALLQ